MPISESVVVTWIIMAVVTLLCICLVRNLSVERVSKKQLILETAVGGMNHFFEEIIGKEGKRYIPYLMSVGIYIGIANLIGLLGFKPPTKDMNVTAALAIMSIILIEYAGFHQAIVIVHASFRKCFGSICSNGIDQDYHAGFTADSIQFLLRHFRWIDSGVCVCIFNITIYKRSTRIITKREEKEKLLCQQH